MRNLDQKLSHLELSQRLELTKLIWEYKQLFSDIPTTTKKTYHDVDVGSSLPIKQHPCRMNTIKQNITDRLKYRQTDRQTGRQTDRHTYRQTDDRDRKSVV